MLQEQNGLLTTIKFLIAPVIFSILSFGLKKFISKWLEESMRDQETHEPDYEKLEKSRTFHDYPLRN